MNHSSPYEKLVVIICIPIFFSLLTYIFFNKDDIEDTTTFIDYLHYGVCIFTLSGCERSPITKRAKLWTICCTYLAYIFIFYHIM